MEGQSRSWVGMVVGIAIAVVVTGVLITTLTSPNIAAREAMASRAITTLTAAEADFRANDRDRNHVNDFWTGDVSGLYYLKPVDGGFELRLIDVEVANADARPIRSLPEGSGPRKGYRYLSLDRNDDLAGEQGATGSIPTGAAGGSIISRSS